MVRNKGKAIRNTMRSLLSFRVREDYIEADGKMFFLFRIHPKNMTILSKEEKREEARRFQHMLDALDMKFSIFVIDKTENLDEIKRYYESLVAERPDFAFINSEILMQLTAIEQTSACVQRAFYMIIKVKDRQEADNFVSQMQGCFIYSQAQREEIIVVLRNHILREFTSFKLYIFMDQIRERLDSIRRKGKKVKRPAAVAAPIRPAAEEQPEIPAEEKKAVPAIAAEPPVEIHTAAIKKEAPLPAAAPDPAEDGFTGLMESKKLEDYVDLINPPCQGVALSEPSCADQDAPAADEAAQMSPPAEPGPLQVPDSTAVNQDCEDPGPADGTPVINPLELQEIPATENFDKQCQPAAAAQVAAAEEPIRKRKEDADAYAETPISTPYQPAQQPAKKAGSVAGRGLWPFA